MGQLPAPRRSPRLRILAAAELARLCAGLTIPHHAGISKAAHIAPAEKSEDRLFRSFGLNGGGAIREEAPAHGQGRPGRPIPFSALSTFSNRSAAGLPAACVRYGGQVPGGLVPYETVARSARGIIEPVNPEPDPGGTGLCIFPVPASEAQDSKACKPTDEVLLSAGRSGMFMGFGGLLFTVLYMWPLTRTAQQPEPEHRPRRQRRPPPSAPPVSPPEPLAPDPMELEKAKMAATKVGQVDNGPLYFGMTLNLGTTVFMAASTQALLRLPERNAMLAADTFLTPFADIFQFLEDAVSVRIGFAIGANDLEALTAVLWLGILGGALLGAFAAGITTALAFWPEALQTLITPDLRFHMVRGCDLLPSAATIVADSRGYWFLRSWSWPIAFAGMALNGFLLGTRQTRGLCFALTLSNVVKVWAWLKGVNYFEDRLDALGWATFLSSSTFTAVGLLMVLILPPSAVMKPEAGQAAAPAARPKRGLEAIGREATVQGLQAMALEVCVQVGLSLGVYTAGSMGVGPMYQVSAMHSAMPLYGFAFPAGLSYTIKLAGSMLIGRGCFNMYRKLMNYTTGWSIAFAGLAFCTTYFFRTSLAFLYGAPSCMYASSAGCMPVYAGIFGQGASDRGSLQESFGAFAFAAVSLSLFTCFKSSLYGCGDFGFMTSAAAAVLLLVSIPAICIARFFFETTRAVVLAMYLPLAVLTLVFGARLQRNTYRMVQGTPGPWTQESGSTSPPSFS